MKKKKQATPQKKYLPRYVRIPLIFAVIGLIVLGFGLYQLFQLNQTKRWPVVTGKVTASNLLTNKETSITSDSGSYELKVTYRYVVKGKRYTSNRISLTTSYIIEAPIVAKKLEQTYARNKEVQVHYNPAKPERAILIPEVSLETKYIIYMGLVSIGIGALILCISLLGGRPEKSKQKYKGGTR